MRNSEKGGERRKLPETETKSSRPIANGREEKEASTNVLWFQIIVIQCDLRLQRKGRPRTELRLQRRRCGMSEPMDGSPGKTVAHGARDPGGGTYLLCLWTQKCLWTQNSIPQGSHAGAFCPQAYPRTPELTTIRYGKSRAGHGGEPSALFVPLGLLSSGCCKRATLPGNSSSRTGQRVY